MYLQTHISLRKGQKSILARKKSYVGEVWSAKKQMIDYILCIVVYFVFNIDVY